MFGRRRELFLPQLTSHIGRSGWVFLFLRTAFGTYVPLNYSSRIAFRRWRIKDSSSASVTPSTPGAHWLLTTRSQTANIFPRTCTSSIVTTIGCPVGPWHAVSARRARRLAFSPVAQAFQPVVLRLVGTSNTLHQTVQTVRPSGVAVRSRVVSALSGPCLNRAARPPMMTMASADFYLPVFTHCDVTSLGLDYNPRIRHHSCPAASEVGCRGIEAWAR